MGRLCFSQPVTSVGACVCVCVAAVSSVGDVSLGVRLHTSRLAGKLKAITSDIGRGHSGYHVHALQQRHSSTHCWRSKQGALVEASLNRLKAEWVFMRELCCQILCYRIEGMVVACFHSHSL